MLGVMRAAVLLQIERSEAIPLVETTFQNSSVRKIYISMKFWKSSLPVYYDANDALEMAKEEAWKHLLDKSSNGDNYQKNEDIYLDAFKGVVMQLQSWKD